MGDGQDGASLRGTPRAPLPVGAYEVQYRVVGRDGDLISGSFTFGVATSVGAATADTGGQPGNRQRLQLGTTLLRGLLFLGLALGLGSAYLTWRVDRATGGLPGIRPLLRSGSVLALTGVLGLLSALGPVDALARTATAPGAGRLLGLQAVLLVGAVVTARWPGRGALAAGLLLLVVAVEGARAHPGEVDGLPGAALTVTHLMAGALWLGGLVHVLRLAAAWRTRRLAVRVAVQTYARSALVLFVLVAATGTASALVLLPSARDWTGTTYGRVLLVKLAVFAGVVALAVLARAHLRRSQPREAPEDAPVPPLRTQPPQRSAPGTQPPLGRLVAVEAGLLAAVVLTAAAVTSVTPARLVPVSALLPAPVGPAVRVAERANQVSVSLVASQGRVEVHAAGPDDGQPLQIRLTGRARPAGGASRALALSSCGPRCWTGPVQWADGTNELVFDVDAGRYQAGRVTIPVSWPVVPAPELLARVQTAMGARSAIDTVEQVTSGFGAVLPYQSRRTGQEFLASQPWSDGGATDAVLVSDAGRRTLLFALPALGYHFAMQLDDADRIVSERIVTPNHLLTRDYRYP